MHRPPEERRLAGDEGSLGLYDSRDPSLQGQTVSLRMTASWQERRLAGDEGR